MKKIINPDIDLSFLLKFENLNELLENTFLYKIMQYKKGNLMPFFYKIFIKPEI